MAWVLAPSRRRPGCPSHKKSSARRQPRRDSPWSILRKTPGPPPCFCSVGVVGAPAGRGLKKKAPLREEGRGERNGLAPIKTDARNSHVVDRPKKLVHLASERRAGVIIDPIERWLLVGEVGHTKIMLIVECGPHLPRFTRNEEVECVIGIDPVAKEIVDWLMWVYPRSSRHTLW